MNLLTRAAILVVGVWIAWSQLGQLEAIVNMRPLNILSTVLLAAGVILTIFAIKPNLLRKKRWWEIWK